MYQRISNVGPSLTLHSRNAPNQTPSLARRSHRVLTGHQSTYRPQTRPVRRVVDINGNLLNSPLPRTRPGQQIDYFENRIQEFKQSVLQNRLPARPKSSYRRVEPPSRLPVKSNVFLSSVPQPKVLVSQRYIPGNNVKVLRSSSIRNLRPSTTQRPYLSKYEAFK